MNTSIPKNSAFDWLNDGLAQMDGLGDPGVGAENIEKQRELVEALQQQENEIAKLFTEVFSQGRGPELLEHLRDRTINTSTMFVAEAIHVGHEIALSPENWLFIRAGQNSVVHHIDAQLRKSREISKGEENGETNENQG